MSRIRFFCGVWIGLVCSAIGYGQDLTIQNQSGEPIKEVLISGDSLTLLTNDKGYVNLSPFGPKERLLIQHTSYTGTSLPMEEARILGKVIIQLEPARQALDTIVVPYNKWELDPDEVPVEIIRLHPASQSHLPSQTSADMLAATGQVFVQKSQFGGGSPMIRGFAANRVLIVVDGVRMNNAIFRSGNLQNIISVDPFSIQSGEVILGPGSMIYGSDALGGVIDFHSLTPKYAVADSTIVGGNAVIRSASASWEKTIHGDVHYSTNKWGILTSFTLSDYDDLIMGSHGPDEYLRPTYVDRIFGRDSVITNPDPRVQVGTGYRQMNFLNKVQFRPVDGWDLSYGFHFSETSDIPRYDRLIQERNGTLRYGDWYYGPQSWQLHTLNVYHNGHHRLMDQVRITAGYQSFEESRNDRGLNETDLRQRTERVRAFNLNADFDKTLKDSSVLYYGIEAVYNRVRSLGWQVSTLDGTSSGVAPRYPDGSSWESNAAYVSYKRALHESVSLIGGVRYNQIWVYAPFDTTYYQFPFDEIRTGMGALSGSLGAAWRLSRLWKINANLATGFRAPNIDDIGKVFDSEPGNVVVPNEELKPEYAYTADVGFTYTDRDLAGLEFSGFYTILDNAIVREDFQFNGEDSILYDGQMSRVQALVNSDGAVIYGASVAGKWNFVDQFWVRGALNWADGRTTDGEPMRHVAPFFGDVHLQYLNKEVGLTVDVFARYNGARSYANLAETERNKAYLYASDANGNPYQPEWYTLNASAAYKLSDVTFQFGVENILDARYRTYSSGVSAAGRNFYGSIRYTF